LVEERQRQFPEGLLERDAVFGHARRNGDLPRGTRGV
jgi:hypothetical protein